MNEEEQLLQKIGVSRFEDLLPRLAAELLLPEINLPAGQTELELSQEIEALAQKNKTPASFLGAGAYDHFVPQTVWELAKRGEFLTAYTPYQAEASQGTLLALFEFQSLVCRLFKMDLANASQYEGATSLAEAAMLARRWFLEELSLTPQKILIPRSLHPHYKECLATYLKNLAVQIIEIPYDRKTGKLALRVLENELKDPGVFAFVVNQPNFFGIIEDIDHMAELRRRTQALLISVVNNPLSLGLLAPPGDYAADIAVSEGQPLGLPLCYGGPYVGLFACRERYMRKMPGRIVGQTVDRLGRKGYTLTLQTREQHIRREKATSNICTNQTLCALAATIYLSLLGPEGLREVSELSFSKAHELWARLKAQGAGHALFDHEEFFQEFAWQPRAAKERLEAVAMDASVLPGYFLGKQFPELKDGLLICCTEKTKNEDMEKLGRLLLDTLRQPIKKGAPD